VKTCQGSRARTWPRRRLVRSHNSPAAVARDRRLAHQLRNSLPIRISLLLMLMAFLAGIIWGVAIAMVAAGA
jgi:hypothetical protein